MDYFLDRSKELSTYGISWDECFGEDQELNLLLSRLLD